MTRQEKIENILRMIKREGGIGVKISKDKIVYCDGMYLITIKFKEWGVPNDKEE